MKVKFLLALFYISWFSALKAQVISLRPEQSLPIVLEKVSLPLRDLPYKPIDISGPRVQRENESLEPERQMPRVNPHALPIGADPALQKFYPDILSRLDSAGGEITVHSDWAGLSANIDPSDNCIAVGPDHVVQMANNTVSTLLRVWNKSGTVLVSNALVEDFTGINDYGDPNIIYDQQADRFVFLVLYGTQSKLIVCVSETNDPTGSWYVYSFNTAGGFPDFPKLSVWGDTYYITTNSNSPSMFAIERSALLNGSPMGFVQKFSLSALPGIDFQAPSPVSATGSILPPAGDDAIIIRVADDAWGGNLDSDQIQIFKVHIDWNDSTNNELTGPLVLGTISYNSAICPNWDTWNCIPQPNSSQKLDPLGNIIMDKAHYRAFADHETIVCTHVVDDGSNVAGIRWYELRKEPGTDWFIYQQGTYSPPDEQFRWMSTITINDEGVIALGYNISGDIEFPGIRVTGRTGCDEYGFMSTPETTIKDGNGAQNSSNRYGDYNGIVVDPSDGSFWMTAQYNPNSNWQTRVAHFSIENCINTSSPTIPFVANTLKFTPVPAANRLEIRMFSQSSESDASLHFISASGKNIRQENFPIQSGENKSELDVSDLETGFYIVELRSQAGSVFQKLVIER